MSFEAFAKPAAPAVDAMSADARAEQEPQYVTSTTPSGIEVYYSWAPRRHYKLRLDADDLWQEVPSVTTVLGVLDKSGPLTWWSQGNAMEGLLELFNRELLYYSDLGLLMRDGTQATKESLVDLLVSEKLSCNHAKDKAADRGVNVHSALERWTETKEIMRPEDYPEHERGYVQGLTMFLTTLAVAGNSWDNLVTELMVGSLKHQYAGRFDLRFTLTKPTEVITKTYPKRKPKIEEIPAGVYTVDLKSSKRIYDSHRLQLEAYEYAAVECGYGPSDYRAVLHVTADGWYEFSLNQDWCFEDFLAVRKVYSVLNEREILRTLREDLGAKEVK